MFLDFFNNLQNYDLVILTETWCTHEFYSRVDHYFKDFRIIKIEAVRECSRGRFSGGILVGIKKILNLEIDFINETFCPIILIKKINIKILPILEIISSNYSDHDSLILQINLNTDPEKERNNIFKRINWSKSIKNKNELQNILQNGDFYELNLVKEVIKKVYNHKHKKELTKFKEKWYDKDCDNARKNSFKLLNKWRKQIQNKNLLKTNKNKNKNNTNNNINNTKNIGEADNTTNNGEEELSIDTNIIGEEISCRNTKQNGEADNTITNNGEEELNTNTNHISEEISSS